MLDRREVARALDGLGIEVVGDANAAPIMEWLVGIRATLPESSRERLEYLLERWRGRGYADRSIAGKPGLRLEPSRKNPGVRRWHRVREDKRTLKDVERSIPALGKLSEATLTLSNPMLPLNVLRVQFSDPPDRAASLGGVIWYDSLHQTVYIPKGAHERLRRQAGELGLEGVPADEALARLAVDGVVEWGVGLSLGDRTEEVRQAADRAVAAWGDRAPRRVRRAGDSPEKRAAALVEALLFDGRKAAAAPDEVRDFYRTFFGGLLGGYLLERARNADRPYEGLDAEVGRMIAHKASPPPLDPAQWKNARPELARELSSRPSAMVGSPVPPPHQKHLALGLAVKRYGEPLYRSPAVEFESVRRLLETLVKENPALARAVLASPVAVVPPGSDEARAIVAHMAWMADRPVTPLTPVADLWRSMVVYPGTMGELPAMYLGPGGAAYSDTMRKWLGGRDVGDPQRFFAEATALHEFTHVVDAAHMTVTGTHRSATGELGTLVSRVQEALKWAADEWPDLLEYFRYGAGSRYEVPTVLTELILLRPDVADQLFEKRPEVKRWLEGFWWFDPVEVILGGE